MAQIIATIVPGTVANIDKTAPVINEITATPSTSEASITVTLNFTETQSGVKTVNWQYKEGGQDWKNEVQTIPTTDQNGKKTGDVSGSIEHKFGSLAEGKLYKFKATVTDVATNTSGESTEDSAATVQPTVTPSTDIIGDYVNYPIDINNNSKTTDDWRVFYVGQKEDGQANGRIFLIAADYVASTCSELTQAIRDAGMKKASDENYEAYYWNPPPVYDCNDGRGTANQDKAQCSFPELFMPANQYCINTRRYFCSDHTNNANSQCASRLQCTGDWKTFAKEEYAEYAIGGPTLNMWVESWNTKHESERKLYANGQSNDYGYYVGTTATTTDFYQNLSNCKSGCSDTVYFPHQTDYNDLDHDGQLEFCTGYWLGSSGAAYDAYALMFVSYNAYVTSTRIATGSAFGVRPVVCLKSKAKLKYSGQNSDR